MRCTHPALPPCKLLTLARIPTAPFAPLAPTVRLAQFRAPLRALPAAFDPTPLSATVHHTPIRPPTGALRTPGDHTPLPTTVSHAEARSAVDALRANPAPVEHTPLPAPMPFTKRRASFRPLITPDENAALPAPVRLTIHSAPLCAFRASVHLAPTSPAVGDAEANLPLGTPCASVDFTAFPAAMTNAESGFATRCLVAAVRVTATSAAAMGNAKVGFAFGALRASEVLAPPPTPVGLAVRRPALSALVAAGLHAPLAPAVPDAKPGCATCAFRAP